MNPLFHLFLTFGFVMCNHSVFWFALVYPHMYHCNAGMVWLMFFLKRCLLLELN
jgi:hypothetical protein